MNTVEDVVDLLVVRGIDMYGGETVTQLEHALQCAAQAEAADAPATLVAACLLHDFGHLIQRSEGGPDDHGTDDVHQYIAIPFLRPVFGEAVLEPIRLHVDAKRYLCFADAAYWASLSKESQRSLELQGGAFDEADAARFIQQPYAKDAVQLRIWDDLAKTPARATPGIAHFKSVLRGLAR
jgi:phosphonate degradation associated HDIG domain protein